jgi:hypothetical protein
MGHKIEVDGRRIATISNAELTKLAEDKGKKANKARMELIRRGAPV